MKVLYSCLSKSWGGMEMYTLTSIRQLLLQNIQVELLCISGSTLHNEAKQIGIGIHPIKNDSYINPHGIFKITSLLIRRNFDLIHTHASRDLWLLVPALKIYRRKIPLVLTKHIGSFIVKKDFMHRWLYGRVTKAFAISGVIRKNLIQTTPLPDQKVLLVHNGIDIEKFNPAEADRKKTRKEFEIADDEILVGMMGRFSPGKGHEEFLMAAKILNEKNYNSAKRLKFIITGEASFGEEEYEIQIRKMAEDLNLKNIIFTGYRDDTKNILSAMDIFILPSHAEAFGLVLTEAMAMGIPSVSSGSDGVLDITVDNETGFLFENKNPEDLAEKIFKLISDPELRKKFGTAARQRVIGNFNLEKQTGKILKIYQFLITGKE